MIKLILAGIGGGMIGFSLPPATSLEFWIGFAGLICVMAALEPTNAWV